MLKGLKRIQEVRSIPVTLVKVNARGDLGPERPEDQEYRRQKIKRMEARWALFAKAKGMMYTTPKTRPPEELVEYDYIEYTPEDRAAAR